MRAGSQVWKGEDGKAKTQWWERGMVIFPSPFLTTVFWPSHPPLSTLDFQPSCHKPNYLFLLFLSWKKFVKLTQKRSPQHSPASSCAKFGNFFGKRKIERTAVYMQYVSNHALWCCIYPLVDTILFEQNTAFRVAFASRQSKFCCKTAATTQCRRAKYSYLYGGAFFFATFTTCYLGRSILYSSKDQEI